MQLVYAFLTGLTLGSSPRASLAPPDSGRVAPPLLSPWLLKGGLRLTHLDYSRTATAWRLLMPWSLAAEYRLGARFSLCAQLDADVQLASAARRWRRRSPAGTAASLPTAALGLGGRCYYGRPAGLLARQAGVPELGKYLALEAGAALSQPNSRAQGATVAPSLYALWGVQNRLRPHLLYDLNAGLGLLAPTRTQAEATWVRHGWDVGAQVNIRLYVAN